MSQDRTTRRGGTGARPIRVLWVLANDRAKADTLSLVRWVRGLDRRRVALTVAFLSAPTGEAGPSGEFAAGETGLTIADALRQAGAGVLHWPGGNWLGPRALSRAARLVAAERIEVVQSVYLRADLFAAALTRAAGLLTRPPRWVVRAAGIGPYRRVRLYALGGLRTCGEWLDRSIYRQADHLVAVSEAVRADWSLRLRRPVTDFTVIHNCVPPRPARLKRDAPAVRERYGAGATDRLILTVGRLGREKGVEMLVEAAGRLRSTHPEARWVVLGEGPTRDRLNRMIDRLGLGARSGPDLVGATGGRGTGQRFFMPGNRADVWQHLLAADLFVLPSRMEGCPNALLEAASAGLPIVAMSVGGVPELLAHERQALLVEPRRGVDGLADGVGRLLADRDLSRRLGSAARERVAETFNARRAAEQYGSLYERLAGRGADGTGR